MLEADSRSGNRVRIMSVHAAELDRGTIEQNHAVDDGDFPDTDAFRNGFVIGLEQEGVKGRILRIPEPWILDIELKIALRRTGLEECGAVGVKEGDADGHRLTKEVEMQADGSGITVNRSPHKEIRDAVKGPFQEVDVPENTAGPELILVLKVTARAPFKDKDGQSIFAIPKEVRDPEFGSRMGDLTIADELAVQPDEEEGIDALKVQKRVRGEGVRMVREGMEVSAAGVIMGNEGRVEGEGVTDIGILLAIVPSGLPDAGDRNGIPAAGIEARCPERLKQIVDTLEEAEAPGAVQELEAVRSVSVFNEGSHRMGSGDKVRAGREGVQMQVMEIFEAMGNNHTANSFLKPGGGDRLMKIL